MRPGFGQAPNAPKPEAGDPVPMAIPPGALVQYFNDLVSGVLVPEDMRIEDLEFRLQIDPAGQVIFQSPAVTLISRYQLAIRRVVGFIMDPDLSGAAPFLVRFNINEQGRNFPLFKRPVPMQSLLSRPGEGTVAQWDGVYITTPGTDLAVEWFVDSPRWAALVGTSKEMGVQILGDYIACAPGP